jgi:prepilin-type N-terminal cleavage/methylation domain-containing protein
VALHHRFVIVLAHQSQRISKETTMKNLQDNLTKRERGGAPRVGSTPSMRRGFTLIQLLAVMAIIAVLAAITLGSFGNSRLQAQRAQCDVNLKAITMALDAFRQEQGHFPQHLDELVAKRYLTEASMLRCPTDPRPGGSYDEYYVLRAARSNGELPILVCPLCAGEGHRGMQAFKGRYTKQFATRPAEFIAVSAVTIERPGKNPISARTGMQLRGGDVIRTAGGGSATVRFADGSTSTLGSDSEITLLQSFIAGNTHAPLYTIVRQKAGHVAYQVTHGSKFDVATPTATAGALGTAFEIKEAGSDVWMLKVTESRVMVSGTDGSSVVTPRRTGNDTPSNGGPEIVTGDWVTMDEGQAAAPNDPVTPTPPPTGDDDEGNEKPKKPKKPKHDDDDDDD